MKEYNIGIDVGGTKTAFGLFEDETLIYKDKIPTISDISQKEFVDATSNHILTILAKHNIPEEALSGVALAMPSYVDSENGIVVSTPNILKLSNFPAREMFRETLPEVRMIVDNDTNAAALAEHRLGAGRGYKHMVYTAISSGLGSGFIINNELYRGSGGGAGESGHMIVNPGETQDYCGCGNGGCFMGQAAGIAIIRHTLKAIESGQKTILTELVDHQLDQITAVTLKQAFDLDDPLAIQMVDQMGYYIGLYTYNLFVSFNFSCYVYGGGLVAFGQSLFERIRNTFDQYNNQAGQDIIIKQAELGEDCGLLGARALLER